MVLAEAGDGVGDDSRNAETAVFHHRTESRFYGLGIATYHAESKRIVVSVQWQQRIGPPALQCGLYHLAAIVVVKMLHREG
ncbi:MAG: hypothetical protein IJ739_03795, partial [Bacteroidaceae bacterium]|nr:hypothetical protein [Bacteroidaceae bacterium]